MTVQIIRSQVPIVVVLQSDNEQFSEFMSEFESDDLTLAVATTTDCLTDYTQDQVDQLSAFVIDGSSGHEMVQDIVSQIDRSFIADGGPVVVLVNNEPEVGDPLLNLPHIKIVNGQLGSRSMRRFIAEEIESYRIVSALRREIDKRTSAIGQIVQGVFEFKTRREAQNLATMLSLTCTNPMPVAVGLTELFINAIEHGCLEIGHDEKGQLIEAGQLVQEISSRQKAPQFCDRVATVEFNREADKLCFVIRDPGPGFDYEAYMGDCSAHEKKHGRGIVMARGCFAELSYHGCGNEVRAIHYF